VARPRPRRAADPRRRTTSITSLLVAIVAAAGLALFYLSQSSQVAATGYQIDALQARVNALRAEQQQLVLRIGQARSPATIAAGAERLHLVPLDQSVVRFAPTSTERPD
jgi:cell division protein FtsB